MWLLANPRKENFVTNYDSALRMAYEWPQYLTCLTTLPQSYLKELGQLFLNDLRSQSIVVSEKANWAYPDKLRIVTQNYRQKNGNLILNFDDMSEITLSRQYSEKAIAGLRTIGVCDFNPPDFFQYFEMFTKLNGGRDFQSRSLDWHIRIAAVLVRELRMICGRYTPTELNICRRCCIIPLQSGSWTSFDSGKVYLRSDKISNETTPTGLRLQFVDEKAASDPDRYSLFRELGVEVLGLNDVCKNILDLHRTQQVLNLSIDELVSHAVYLFSAGYSPQKTDRLRFVSEDGRQISNETLYVFWATPPSLARRYFPPGCHVISRLHGNYEVAADASRIQAWLKWLLLWPNLSRWPPIHENGTLSRPMRYILQNQGSKRLLEYMKVYPRTRSILADSWNRRSSLLAQISKIKVSTESGDFELRETALPVLREKGNGFLNILNLEQPDDPRWAFLEEFGVLTKVDIRLYLQQLRSIQKNLAAPSKNILASIYRDMGQHIHDQKMVLLVSQKGTS